MIDLAAALRAAVGAIEGAGADYVVVGSTAASVWGVARATRDVDVIVVVGPEAAAALVERLDRVDLYVPVEEALAAITHGGSFNVLHPSTGGRVDVFVRRDDFARERVRRRIRAEILGEVVWVATPEDVLLAKLHRRVESPSEMQWRDCVEIAATQALDRDYMGRWAEPLGIVDDLAALLAGVPPV